MSKKTFPEKMRKGLHNNRIHTNKWVLFFKKRIQIPKSQCVINKNARNSFEPAWLP